MLKKVKVALFIVVAALLSACGGGGDGGNGNPPTFQLRQAYIDRLIIPSTYNASISGTVLSLPVTGRGIAVFDELTNSNFLGQSRYQQTNTLSGEITVVGVVTPYESRVVAYYDANYNLVGSIESDVVTQVTSLSSLPETVNVGQNGPFYNANTYTNLTLDTQVGTEAVTYSVEADSSPDSVLVFFDTVFYDLNGNVTSELTKTFRLYGNGFLVPLSEDQSFALDSSLTITYH